jgi:uncharacterized protein YjdB
VRAAEITFATRVPSTLVVGDSLRLTPVPRARSGKPLPSRPVGFTSSDVRRARVSNTGLVTAVAPGPVRITASCDGEQAHVQLVVRPAPASPT